MNLKPNPFTDIVVLAAGQGKRMHSNLHKVLHTIADTPMLDHCLHHIANLHGEKQIHLVYGHKGQSIIDHCQGQKQQINFVEQQQQLGTGHAVQQAINLIADNSVVLICYADVPLVQTSTLSNLIDKARQGNLAILTVHLDNPTGYGRIIRNQSGHITSIVEQKDGNAEQLAVKEVNTGIMAIPAMALREFLPKIDNNNKQGEYYLTDVIKLANQQQLPIVSQNPTHPWEVDGVNNQLQRTQLERKWQQYLATTLQADGLAIADSNRFDLRGNLSFGKDCFVDINTIISGSVVLGNNVRIEANCHLIDCSIADNSIVKANSIVEQTAIGSNVVIGPFARIRPLTEIKDNARIGNFVEVKKSIIGIGSKVNHLSYIGDAQIGQSVNVGAGTITCNYDGKNKHQTVIKDNAFIGSNTALIAPIEIGANVLVGAGTTISKSIEANMLVTTRVIATITKK